MKLVSVIIPCYKDSNTLCRAINSVVAQSYKPIEIIVINDCSPETEIIEEYIKKYPRIKYFYNKINLGLAASRNKGIHLAKGEIVAFLDADDEYHPDKIKIQLEYLKENTVVTCHVLNILPNGQRYSKSGPDRSIIKPLEIIFSNKLNGAGLLCQKELILRVGGYNPSLKSCEDYDLWLRLLSCGIRVNVISMPLYIYYFNPTGLSKNIRDISKWEFKVLRKYFKRHRKNNSPSSGELFILSSWIFKHLVRYELTRDPKLKELIIKNCKLLNNSLLAIFLLFLLRHFPFATFVSILKLFKRN